MHDIENGLAAIRRGHDNLHTAAENGDQLRSRVTLGKNRGPPPHLARCRARQQSLDGRRWQLTKDRMIAQDLKVVHCHGHRHIAAARETSLLRRAGRPGSGDKLRKFCVLLTHSIFDDRFGRIPPAREAARLANVHRDGDPTKHMTLVCFLPKGELSVLAHYIAALAKRTNFARISARHVEKLWHRRRPAKYEQAHPGHDAGPNSGWLCQAPEPRDFHRAPHLAGQGTASSLVALPPVLGSNAVACENPPWSAAQTWKRASSAKC